MTFSLRREFRINNSKCVARELGDYCCRNYQIRFDSCILIQIRVFGSHGRRHTYTELRSKIC